MEESEKMTALKTAYAEIILNTAKEAAARIMMSERKAHQYRHELSSTKEEALRLLLRLKLTMDSQINEAEMKSQDQQRKIEVLEAQLQEAEDIVSSLRAELDVAHTKLYKLGKTQMRNGSKAMYKADDENIGSSQPEPGNGSFEVVVTSQADPINNGPHGDSIADNYLEESDSSGDLEIPSIISRRREPNQSLNRCTQSLHTCDGNLSKGDLKNVKALRNDKEGEKVCFKEPIISYMACDEEEEGVDIKKVEDEDPVNIMQIFKSLRKRRNRGGFGHKIKKSSLKSVSHIGGEGYSDFSISCAHLCDSHKVGENDNEDTGAQSNSPWIAPSDVSEKGIFSFQSNDKLIEPTQQSVSGSSLAALGSNTDLEMNNSSSLNVDVKLLETSDGLSSPPSKDRVLKYTFQRKRKRDSVVSDDNNLLHEENPASEIIARKENGNLKHVKSNEVTESSRDGRSTSQLARQLVYMSEKKWIK